MDHMVITFGEALLRFGTLGPALLAESERTNFYVGGSELNVAMALAAQGLPARWVSCLPDREVGELALRKIARVPVDLTHVRRAPGRMAYYLLEVGIPPRASRVIERQKGVLGERDDLAFDWPAIFQDARWFHSTGITAGLSHACREALSTAMALAAARGIPVSYDFNYRRTVWASLDAARAVQIPLLENVNVLFCSAVDLKTMFAAELPPAHSDEHYAAVRETLAPYRLDAVVLSERGRQDGRESYRVAVLAGGATHHSRDFPLEVVDRIGAGDAMSAGYIRARLEARDPGATADFAGFCGALKHTIPGDYLPLNKDELERLYRSEGGLSR